MQLTPLSRLQAWPQPNGVATLPLTPSGPRLNKPAAPVVPSVPDSTCDIHRLLESYSRHITQTGTYLQACMGHLLSLWTTCGSYYILTCSCRRTDRLHSPNTAASNPGRHARWWAGQVEVTGSVTVILLGCVGAPGRLRRSCTG